MRHYTRKERERGELAAWDLSESAAREYCGCDGYRVYELDTDDGKRYDLYIYAESVADGLTFAELEKLLEEIDAETRRQLKECADVLGDVLGDD